jgi:hypothetical protein
MTWIVRGVAAASVLALAACGGSERPGQLSMAPRPELTEPPGEMSARMLITVSQLAAPGQAADGPAARRGLGPRWGVIGISEMGAGVTLNADFRNALPGLYTVKLLDDDSCAVFSRPADLDDKPEFVETLDDAPLRLPQIAVDADGEAKREYTAGGLVIRDFRDRAIVLFDGNRPIACGAATSAPGLPAPLPPKMPPGASSGGVPGGGR